VIARLLAWLLRTDELAAARAELRQVHKALSTEQMTSAHLDAEVKRLVRQNNVINLRADAAIAEATRVRADAEYVAAARCECGGDAELYWRTRAHEAERQARQDRANALRMADQVQYWRERYNAAEHQVHVAEQLGRAQ
jgi:hypothetical protein